MSHESAPQPNQFENKPAKRVEGVEHVELPKASTGVEENSHIQTEIKQAETRRAFLLRNVRAALGLLGAKTMVEKTDAQIATYEYGEKSNESPAYKEGILDMYKLALKKKNEVAKVYAQEGDNGYWADIGSDEKKFSALIDFEKLAKALPGNPERIDITHTHPKNMIKAELNKLKAFMMSMNQKQKKH